MTEALPSATTLPDTRLLATDYLGWDIGGANLKVAAADGQSVSRAFALWRHPNQLAALMTRMAAMLPATPAWAVTMTGEMTDAFVDRAIGVRRIIDQTLQAARQCQVDEVRFYAIPGQFLAADQARQVVDQVASANWHALSLWLARGLTSPAMLIDIGGTTTDIIPLLPSQVATDAVVDLERLQLGQLVYVGGQRTPVCSLVDHLPYRGRQVPIMREVFATTDDCGLVLGVTPAAEEDHVSCDGQPRTVEAATNRLARMIGLDRRSVSVDQARELANAARDAACQRVAEGIAQQPEIYRQHWILTGHGIDFFLPSLLQRFSPQSITRLDQLHDAAVARVAPAYACIGLISTARISAGHPSADSNGS